MIRQSLKEKLIKVNQLKRLIRENKQGKLIYSPSKSKIKKIVNAVKGKNERFTFQNVVFFIDYFHRINPQNKRLSLTSPQLIVLFGTKYKSYINALVDEGVLERTEADLGPMYTPFKNGKSYIVEKVAYTYRFTDDVSFKFRSNDYFQKIYNEKTDEQIRTFLSNYVDELNDIYNNKVEITKTEVVKDLSYLNYTNPYISSKFVEQYNKSLAHTRVQLSRRQLEKMLENQQNDEDKARIRTLFKNFQNEKYIKKVDNQMRIYSSMTNLPKEIREHINYSWSVDIHNSHPLILSVLLREFFHNGNIKRWIEYFLGLIAEIPNNEIIKSEYDSTLPADVAEYIQVVNASNKFKGTNFWSILTNDLVDLMEIKLERENEKAKPSTRIINRIKSFLALTFKEKRNIVKEKVFTNIFYNKGKIWTNSNEVIEVFQNRFPNVVKAIELIKREIHHICKVNGKTIINYVEKKGVSKATNEEVVYQMPIYEDGLNLATLIMKIESILMLYTLCILYKSTHNSAYFVSIHDAIYCIGRYKSIKSSKIAREKIKMVFSVLGLDPRIGEEKSKYIFEQDEYIDSVEFNFDLTERELNKMFFEKEKENDEEKQMPIMDLTEKDIRIMMGTYEPSVFTFG